MPKPNVFEQGPVVAVYVRTALSSAHQLPDYEGDCANLHGHTWHVEVWVEGYLDKSGMVIDFRKVKKALSKYDHRLLNNLIHNPTAENLAARFLNEIVDCSGSNVTQIRVKVWESDATFAEVSGTLKERENEGTRIQVFGIEEV